MLEEKEQKMGNYINFCDINENQMDIDNKSKTFVDKNKSDTMKKQHGFSSKKNDSPDDENSNINRINNTDANNEMTEEKYQEEDIYNNIYFPDTDYGDKENNFYGEDFNYNVEVNRSFASYHVSHNQTSENFTENMAYKTEVTNDNTNK